MAKSPIFKVIAFLVIGVAGVDLLFGDTGTPLLPDFIANVLTPTIDALVIIFAVLALIFL